MITNFFSFRLLSIFLTINSIIFIIAGCDLGDDNKYIQVTSGFDLIGTEIIGSTGGEINLDSIIVKIPDGAFDENTELNIYVGMDKDGFDEYGNSSLYQINGLPKTINKPIRLSIKHNGTLEGDTLVAVGEMKYATSLDSSLYSYHTESASDSAGYLIYDLPAYSSLAKISELDNNIIDGAMNIIGLFGYKTKLSSKGHFNISYPLLVEQQAIIMGEHFETAYTKCQSMGFSYPVRQWPANVLTKTLRQGLQGFYAYLGNSTMSDEVLRSWINDGDFTINSDLLTDDLELRTTCGHEFLHLVQNLYEFSSSIEPEQAWLEEATSVWIMEKFANIANYVASTFNYREHYIFDGWQYKDRGYAKQGYGLSVIIKDIAETYGNAAIVEIFKAIKAGTLPSNATDPVDAVLSVISEPVDYFLHRVLGDYVAGEYYNNKVNVKFLDNPNVYRKAVTIGVNDTLHIISENYWDLSGGLFKVSPGDISTLNQNKLPLSFKIGDPVNCGIVVYKYKQGSEIGFLDEVFPGKNGEVILSNAKPIFDDGYDLVVLVTNSTHDKTNNYLGANYNVELRIEANLQNSQNVFNETYNTEIKTPGSDSTGPNITSTLKVSGEATMSKNNTFKIDGAFLETENMSAIITMDIDVYSDDIIELNLKLEPSFTPTTWTWVHNGYTTKTTYEYETTPYYEVYTQNESPPVLTVNSETGTSQLYFDPKTHPIITQFTNSSVKWRKWEITPWFNYNQIWYVRDANTGNEVVGGSSDSQDYFAKVVIHITDKR